MVPTATYRLQIQPEFTYADAAAQADYLAALGVSHAYLSPVLKPAPGSAHGYDVVDHSRLNEEAGGREAFDAMVAALHHAGVRVVVDVVPNHMTTPTPAWLNTQWWSLLRDGQKSPFAHWFDVDWPAEDGRVLVPVLGADLRECLSNAELSVDGAGGPEGDETVLRYYDHEFPVRPGTEGLELPELVDAQAYRLCHWREGGGRLNYRRFFDVTTLTAVRVEDPEVFDATHRLLLELVDDGSVDGLRIDHPDGLADPGGYLARLADATGDAWVVAEKILEGHEQLPEEWRCAGTTGYDTLLRVGGVFVDPSGERPLTSLWEELTRDRRPLAEYVAEAKELVVREVQAAEVNRLLRLVERVLRGEDVQQLRRGLEALLVAMDRYRAYAVPGEGMTDDAARTLNAAEARASAAVGPEDRDAVAALAQLARGGRLPQAQVGEVEAAREFMVRFQQTCGPVMAKGIEDTAFYRYGRLTALNEVGGDPGQFGIEPAELHDYARRQLEHWPTAMTTLSTHDTKRSEDVRARLAVVAELPHDWGLWLDEARRLARPHRGKRLDAATEYLLWQTAVGAWPIDGERLNAYATKAIREAKLHTTWTNQDGAYEADVARFVDGIVGDDAVAAHVASWVAQTAPPARVAHLGQKLLQLVVPGVPDVYQGTEFIDLSLVDPDNRRLVDYTARWNVLARLDAGEPATGLDEEKLLVTSRALRLRREHAAWFTGEDAVYEPLAVTTPHALALGRGEAGLVQVVAVVTRLPVGLERAGGWGAHHVAVPTGRWRDLLTGGQITSVGSEGVRVANLLSALPVALLVRDES